jgi:hypothetical protein
LVRFVPLAAVAAAPVVTLVRSVRAVGKTMDATGGAADAEAGVEPETVSRRSKVSAWMSGLLALANCVYFIYLIFTR